MRNMLLIIGNILKVTFRKKGNIIVYLILPLIGIVVSLLIYSNPGTASLRVGVADHDNNVITKDLKAELSGSGNFVLSDVKKEDISSQLLGMKLDVAIEIPEGYSDGIMKGEPEKIGVISIKGQDTTVWVEQRLNSFTDSLYRLSLASGGDKAVFEKMYSQYKANSLKLKTEKLEDKLSGRNMALSSVGFLIMFIMLGASFINIIILKEKRDRTYHRICSAPVNARQYIAGNAITSLFVTALQIILMQLVMKFIFRVDTGLSDLALFVILFMFGIVAVGIGLVVAAFSSSSYVANTLSTLIITPTCMLGGCFWPTNIMSDIMQKIGYFTPQRWAMNAITKLQTGGAMGDITINLLILGAFALALTLVAIYRFARTNNVQKFV